MFKFVPFMATCFVISFFAKVWHCSLRVQRSCCCLLILHTHVYLSHIVPPYLCVEVGSVFIFCSLFLAFTTAIVWFVALICYFSVFQVLTFIQNGKVQRKTKIMENVVLFPMLCCARSNLIKLVFNFSFKFWYVSDIKRMPEQFMEIMIKSPLFLCPLCLCRYVSMFHFIQANLCWFIWVLQIKCSITDTFVLIE